MPVPIPTLIWKTGVPLPPEPSGRGVPAYNIEYIQRTSAGITLAGELNRPSPNDPGFTWAIYDITGGTWTKQFYQGARAGALLPGYMATSQGGVFAVTAMDASNRWYNASPVTNALFLRPPYKLEGTTVLYASTGTNDQNPIESSAFDRFFPIRSVRNAIPQSGSERIYGMAIGPSGLIATSVLSNYAKKVKTWPPTGFGSGPVTYHTINPTSAGILDLQYGGGWYIAIDRTAPRLYCSRNGENWTTVTHPSFSRLAWNNSKIVYGAGVFLLGSPYQYSLSNDPTGSWTTIDMGGSFSLAGATDHSRPFFVDNSVNNKLSYFVSFSGTNSGVVNSRSTVIYATLKNEQTSSFFSANWELLPRTWTVNQALNRGNIYTNVNNLISYSSTDNTVLEVRPANRLTDPNPGWYFTAKAKGTATIRAYASGNNIFHPLDEQVGVTVLGINQTAPYGITSSVASGSVYSVPVSTDQGLPLTYQSSNTSVAQITGGFVRILKGGSSTITASNNGNTIYNPFSQSITVSTPTYNQFLNLSIANSISPGYRINLPFLTDAGIGVTYQVTPANIATIQGNVLTIVECGGGTLTATNGGGPGYFPLNNSYTLNNVKCNQNVSVSIPGSVFKTQNYPLNSNTDVGLPVSYTFSNSSVAQILNNPFGQTTGIRFIEAGTGRLNWTNPGSAQYNAVSGSLSITSSKFLQSVNFTVPSLISLGATYLLETGTNVGLPITWSSSNTGIARIINNSLLTVTGCGTVQITASQLGNANYAPLTNAYSRTSPKLQQNTTISVPSKVVFGQKYLVPDFTNQGLPIRYTSLNSGVARITKQ